jgi:Tol biopolymer transport system component
MGAVALAVVGTAAAVAATAASGAGSTTLGVAYDRGNGAPQAYLANANGGDPHRLGQGGLPAISPNGALIAVVPSGGAAVLIYTRTGEVAGRFFTHGVAANQFAWSADSRYLAVQLTDVNAVNTIGKSGVGVIDTSTGTTAMVAPGTGAGLSWSPTSDTLVFGLSDTPTFAARSNLYTSDPTGTTVTQITHNNRSQQPVWGKRGIAFSYTTNRGKQQAPVDQIYLLNGGHTTQITHVHPGPLEDGLVPIAVSADGTRLAASYVGEDTDFGYAVNLVTHSVKSLVVKSQAVTVWGISRDGKRMLVDFGGFENAVSAGTVESMPFGGGTPTVLAKHANLPSWNQ